jgi:acetyl esterase/lipase
MPASQTLDHLETKFKGTPNITDKDASIHTIRRNERTTPTYLVHCLTRTMRSQFGRPKKQSPEGSVQLKPTKVIYKTCTVSERKVCDIYIYDVIPRSIKGRSFTKRIYYFCGGGWQSPPSPQHWQLCAKLARQMPETAISIVSYPLAPKNSAPVAFPWLLRLYRVLMQDGEEEGHRVILAGDSSGGNIVLSLVLEALREDEAMDSSLKEEDKHAPHPTALLVISPSTDLTRSNPEIEKLRHLDPLLTPTFIKETAKAWRGDWDATDRRLSPINADISLLAKYGIRVHGVTGGYDILAPDSIIFRNKCEEVRVTGQWLEWEKQMHCFVLTWPYGLREGREGVGWMIDVLKKE